MELVGPDKRATINGVSNVLWPVGVCVLAFLAYMTNANWIFLGLVGNVPMILGFAYYL
jgi:hypothetical protein